MVEQLDPHRLLARYTDGPIQLSLALADLTDIALNVAQEPNTWTIRQFVHHLVDGDALWTTPIKIALGARHATFDLKWYWTVPQDAWAERWKYSERPIAPSLALLIANRQHVAQLLHHSSQWWNHSLTVEWPNGSQKHLTIADMISIQADHVFAHLNDIQRIHETQSM